VQGPRGIDGNTILNGRGKPSAELGRDGDFYIDTDELRIFGPKSNGLWGNGNDMRVGKANLDQYIRAAQAGQGRTRFFAMGAPSMQVVAAPGGGNTNGLEPILGNGLAIGNNWQTIANDTDGDLIECVLYLRRSGGNEVYTCKVIAFRANTIANLTIAWEAAQPQSIPYTVEFDARVTGTTLELRIRSNVTWDEIRGGYIRL
jgi:hypothetical protein